MEALKHPKETKARVKHNCNFCSLKIFQGEVYMKSTHTHDGEIYDWKTHKHCNEISHRLKMYDDCGEGLTQDDFIENIHSEFANLTHKITPQNEFQKYSEIVQQLQMLILRDKITPQNELKKYIKIVRQLHTAIFMDKLWYVIRYYKKLDGEQLSS